MYSRIDPSNNPSEFAHINPFANHSPFLLFYRGEQRRHYHVAGLGCVTPDLFQATRYEIDSYLDAHGEPRSDLHDVQQVTIPVCIHCPDSAGVYECYAGRQRIELDRACGKTIIQQIACGAKRLARPVFRPGGPFGAVVQTVKHIPGNTLHVAYFGIDLLFYPQGNAGIPGQLEGFTRIGINHFTSIPRYW